MKSLSGRIEGLIRKFRRVRQYTEAAARECIPQFVYRRRLTRIFEAIQDRGDINDLLQRVNYYNRFDEIGTIAIAESKMIDLFNDSYYNIDLRKVRSYFDRNLKMDFKFGDVFWIPETPQIVKSRPIHGDNRNAILLKLDTFRHFRNWPTDRRPFRTKAPRAVWRGNLNNPLRRLLVERYGNNSRHDIGHTSKGQSDIPNKPYLSMQEQLANRYIVSIEGHDVATNLKWIMASNSLCLMPRPRMETWFMEGTLIPDVHYVELQSNFDDFDDKIKFYDENPDAADAIIRAANDYVAKFLDNERELGISLLVLQKYFELSGQLVPKFFARKHDPAISS
jgi:hypothetical protein